MKIRQYELRLDSQGKPVLRENNNNYKVDGRKSYTSPDALDEFFGDVIGICDCADEHVFVACMDVKNHIVGCFEASHGSATASMFPIREILQKSLMLGAVSIAISHNHPSGDPTPSKEDILSTNRLKDACAVIGIAFLDHVVVGRYGYYSFVEHNM